MFYKVCSEKYYGKYFEYFIDLCIVVSMAAAATVYEGMSQSHENAVKV